MNRALRFGVAAIGVGALGVIGNSVFGCAAHTGYCAGWSLLGVLGVLLLLVGLAVAALAYRRSRPSVIAWADERRAREEGEPSTVDPRDQRP